MQVIQEVSAATTVGQIVANNFRSAEVFKKYGIDFCCKGGRPLGDICREKKLDIEQLADELFKKTNLVEPMPEDAFTDLPLNELVAHIENTHHAYVRDSIPVLLSYLAKVDKVHGGRHPELRELFMLFTACAEELTHHMVKEETVLFPAIKRLAEASARGSHVAPFFFGSVARPISEMENEHTAEGERFARIVQLTDNFNPPADACTTYRVAFMKLDEFMNDLFTHIHLENNILFPGAIELEADIVVRAK